MLQNGDSLEFIRGKGDKETDVIFCDPPYGLGSEVVIRPDGKPDYSKAADFMSKWDMPTGDYWEAWFKEAFRTLKHGGYCVMYGMDRQLLLFKYYAALAGFSERQSLYWYFISNFPKASDLSKNLDKNAGAERKEVGTGKGRTGQSAQPNGSSFSDDNYQWPGEFKITSASSPLAKKYDGYKYSVSPLKQTNETIMVFQKPYKTGSCLHDTLAYENGDKMCCCGALDIERGRCPTSDTYSTSSPSDGFHGNIGNAQRCMSDSGRYPAQTFVSQEAGEVLGDTSKILHKCPYEEGEMDLYMYCPKVGKQERNGGCEGMEEKQYKMNRPPDSNPDLVPMINKNPHPTLKPISLNARILRLFKTPNPQKILYPFAGSGSEIIGGIKAGFTDWDGAELNPEYIEIAEARIKYWTKKEEQLFFA